jgi:beta-lactam-binding protein with PASTA domain
MFSKIFQLPVYIHLLAVITVSFLVGYGVLKYIDVYTNHNQAVSVPDVRGLLIEDAAPFLEQNWLRYTIIDSIYSKDSSPGAIVELSPEANASVKKKRIIYITVNAKTEETAPIPDVTDLSARQALLDVNARGFKNVEWKYVTGEFRNLTVGVEYGGKMINAGMRVPLTANLVLVLQDGNITPLEGDTIMEPVKIDDSWYE